MKINIDLTDYIEYIEYRREFIEKTYDWCIPDVVWDYFINLLNEGCIPTDTSASIVVDNIAINGDYGPLEDYIEKGETKEQAIQRIKQDALYYDDDLEYVIYRI